MGEHSLRSVLAGGLKVGSGRELEGLTPASKTARGPGESLRDVGIGLIPTSVPLGDRLRANSRADHSRGLA